MVRVRQRETVIDFGKALLESRDLDPVYVVLWEARLPKPFLCRWLLAYFSFYHMGTASWIVDQGPKWEDYWLAMETAAGSKEWPRGSERRHFRGEAALKSVESMQALRLTCTELIDGLGRQVKPEIAPTFPTVAERVKQWRWYGDWIAFKVADICERLDLFRVRFEPSDIFNMFESPREGAELVAEQEGLGGNPYEAAYAFVWNGLNRVSLAPPRLERQINIQEVETILCKWKSHCGGHYEVGKDIKEIHHTLQHFKTKTAKRLLAAGTSAKLW